MEHTKGELRLIRSPKHSGDIFVKIKGTARKFLCKFYGGAGTEISPSEAEANICHFVQCWNSQPDLLAACEDFMESAEWNKKEFAYTVSDFCHSQIKKAIEKAK